MTKTPHRYHLPTSDESFTPAKLKRLSHAKQLEVMRARFFENYDSPDELPDDSGEGGYQFIWGGPYDAEEALQDEFSGVVPDQVIDKLADKLSDISIEWSGKPTYEPDEDYLAEIIASGTDPFITLMSSLEDIENAAKISAGEKERKTLHKLLFANVIMAFETFLGDLFIKTLGKSDKYVEDFVFKTPHFQKTQIRLSEIFERFRKIDAEVRSYVLAHNWHMLKESGQMYKRAFNIKFPEIPPLIADGIKDRHNIVHRNGKGEDGSEGNWALPEIVSLKEAVLEFAGTVDGKAILLDTTSQGDLAEPVVSDLDF